MTDDQSVPESPDARERRVEALQRAAAAGPPRPADMLAEVIAQAVAEAAVNGELAGVLRSRGWGLVHAPTDATPPVPPVEWSERALDLMLPGWRDPLATVDQLYGQAWLDGYRAHQVAEHGTEP